MRLLYICIVINLFFLILYSLLTLAFFKSNPYLPRTILQKYFSIKQSSPNHTKCLFHLGKALDHLQLPWFINYGTALNYWRSKQLLGDDMDTGIFYGDFQKRNLTEKAFIQFLKRNYRIKLLSQYGRLDHGKEWTFACLNSKITIDIFLFYRYNESKYPFKYWAASYNGLCDDMIYEKCRWGFSDFNLTKIEIQGKQLRIVPLEFIIERYGEDYMIPKNYNYFESLEILPNLIQEYNKTTPKKKKKKNRTN